MFVCRSMIGIGALTAGPIGTGAAPFDAPKQREDYGDNFRVTSASDTCNIASPCKNIQPRLQTKPMDGFNSNQVFLQPPQLDTCHLGKRRQHPLHTCERHVNIDFISLLFAQERLVPSGPVRYHSTQFNGVNITKSIAAHLVSYDTCLWNVTRDLTVFFLLAPQRLHTDLIRPKMWPKLITNKLLKL